MSNNNAYLFIEEAGWRRGGEGTIEGRSVEVGGRYSVQ